MRDAYRTNIDREGMKSVVLLYILSTLDYPPRLSAHMRLVMLLSLCDMHLRISVLI